MKKRTAVLLICLALLLCAFVTDGLLEPLRFQVTQTVLVCEDLPPAFDGFRVVQISDLHGRTFGEDRQELYRAVTEAAPDIIAITGDFAEDAAVAADLCAPLCAIAPTYFVSGNHEQRKTDYAAFCAALTHCGAHIMDNERADILRGGASITLAGLCDPTFLPTPILYGSYDTQYEEILRAMAFDAEDFVLLLAHRPEYFETYCNQQVDLVLTGHTHGGMVRLPLIGALYAPGQGFFPRYGAGLYRQNDTVLYVSRGLGGSFRVLNPPQLCVLELRSA